MRNIENSFGFTPLSGKNVKSFDQTNNGTLLNYFIQGAGVTNPTIGMAGKLLGLEPKMKESGNQIEQEGISGVGQAEDMAISGGDDSGFDGGGIMSLGGGGGGRSRSGGGNQYYQMGATLRQLLQMESQKKFNDIMADTTLDPETRYGKIKELEGMFATKDELLANSPYANTANAFSKDGRYRYDPFKQQWNPIPTSGNIPSPTARKATRQQLVKGGDGYYYNYDPYSGQMNRTNIPHREDIAAQQEESRQEVRDAAKNALDPNFQLPEQEEVTRNRTIGTITGTQEGTPGLYDLLKSKITGQKNVVKNDKMNMSDLPETFAPAESPKNNSQPMYARNKKTGQRIVSYDGGQTWQQAQ
jgi:hypothetical protein